MNAPSTPHTRGGAPYRQVECAACGDEAAADICPVCKRPLCTACQQAREDLGARTLQGMRATREDMDRRTARKEDLRALGERVAYTLGAGVGISALAVALKGLQAVMVGAVIIPMVTISEGYQYFKYRREMKRRGEPWRGRTGDAEEIEAEVATLAPCSASCWGATGLGQDLIHSSAALHYGIYCKACRPTPARSQAEAMAAARILALLPNNALHRPVGHPPMRAAKTLARALGLEP